MNAGAEGETISTFLNKVRFLSIEDGLVEYDIKDLFFGYRTSSFHNMRGFILSASFLLQPGRIDNGKLKTYLAKRRASQPIEEYSAGSIFRNPPSMFAGKLIEDCNLKGAKIGQAKISEKHANFIVNEKNAKAKEVLELISFIKKKVYEKHKIKLKEEIIFLPK